MTRFHSVILRPDSVRRVRPPMMRIPKTKAEQPNSQYGRDLGIVRVVSGAAVVADSGAKVAVASDRIERKDRVGSAAGRSGWTGLKLCAKRRPVENVLAVGRTVTRAAGSQGSLAAAIPNMTM